MTFIKGVECRTINQALERASGMWEVECDDDGREEEAKGQPDIRLGYSLIHLT